MAYNRNPPNSNSFFAASNSKTGPRPADNSSDLDLTPRYQTANGTGSSSLLGPDTLIAVDVRETRDLVHPSLTTNVINMHNMQMNGNLNDKQPPTVTQQLPPEKKKFWHPFPEVANSITRKELSVSDVRDFDPKGGCGSPCFITAFALVGAAILVAIMAAVVFMKIS